MLGSVACLAFLLPAAAAWLVYLVPTVVGLRRRWKLPIFAPRPAFAVLIPAHNEETTLPAALHSLRMQDYPVDQLRIYVVADNCTDTTAHVAASLGATVFVRVDPGKLGKG